MDKETKILFHEVLKQLQISTRMLQYISNEQFKRGYNQCLKDFKIPNEQGQHSL